MIARTLHKAQSHVVRRGAGFVEVQWACKLESVANARWNIWKRARYTKQLRIDSAWYTRAALGIPSIFMARANDARCVVTMTRVGPKPLDRDNNVSACKAVQDGVADAFGLDDGNPWWDWRHAQERGEYAARLRFEFEATI